MNDSQLVLPNWPDALNDEFKKEYMLELKKFLASELDKGKCIYPHGKEMFSSFHATPFSKVKVVLIGQDPYHGPGQAHGLCFSVKPGVRPPPSLVNIYKELQSDLGITPVSHGYLMSWAEQGVLMLNAVLSVEQGKAASHQGKGWEIFTDKVVEILNMQKEHLVFLLWGAYAQAKGASVDRSRHLVLESPHPSPFSANRGFLGNRHFSKTNQYLQQHGLAPINWQLPASVSL